MKGPAGVLPMIEAFLFQLAAVLQYPVMIGVSALALYVVWLLGLFAADSWRRRGAHDSPAVARYRRALSQELAADGDHVDARLERLLQIHEVQLLRALDRVRFVVKVGPSLGLMATLIPMGIALAALAQGDIPKMAGSMVTAFTATVVGLGAGTIAYLLALVEEKWSRADLREMEFATEIALREVEKGRTA
jgi:biopolymer transport protein ExbB/TolQ